MKACLHYPAPRFDQSNPRARFLLDASSVGLRRCGVEVSRTTQPDYVRSDLAVMFGMYKRRFSETICREHILFEQEEAGKNTLVLERGYVKREDYHSVGLDGLNGRAQFAESECGSRWEKLGVELGEFGPRGSAIAVIGQVPWDTSCQHVNFQSWVHRTFSDLREKTNAELIFRPHPLAPDAVRAPSGVDVDRGYPEALLRRCAAVVTFNSTFGVDAAVAGLPVYAEDCGSMVYPIAMKSLDEVAAQAYEVPDRERWARRLAWCQWTRDEMLSGEPFAAFGFDTHANN